MAIVTSRGRITIPKEIREALGIHAGTELELQIVGDGSVRLRKAGIRDAIDRWRGVLDLGEPSDDFLTRLRVDR